ncbi:MAG: alpha-E domain-containing protein [Candidatus Acidiferrales bacterium]
MIPETRQLLSRAADSVYWMARYIERAENVARFIGVNLHLQLDLPLGSANQWQPLIDTSGDAEVFRQRYGKANQSSVIKFLALEVENPNSIYSCLRAARENARSVRETISSEMWEQINSMYLQIQSQRAMPGHEWLPEVLRDIRLACHLFQGITDATMSHNESWHFLQLGRMMERADKTSRILDVKYFILLPSATGVGTPYDDLHWSAVLKSVSGFEMYRKKHGRISPRNIVDFLVMDREFPRAIHYCIHGVDECLRAITGTPMGSFHYPSEQLMGILRAELDFTSVDDMIRDGLHEYLDGLQAKMNAIGDSLYNDFFAGRPLAQTQNQAQTSSAGGSP